MINYTKSKNKALKSAYEAGFSVGKARVDHIDVCPYQSNKNIAFAKAWYRGYEEGTDESYREEEQDRIQSEKNKENKNISCSLKYQTESLKIVIEGLLKIPKWAKQNVINCSLEFVNNFDDFKSYD